MKPAKLVVKESFTVIGVSNKGSHQNSEDDDVIKHLWGEMKTRYKEVDVEAETITGVCLPPRSDDYFYIAGVESDKIVNLPIGMKSFTFPACQYLVFLHEGHINTLFDTYHQIWNVLLPESSYQLAEGPELEVVHIQQDLNPYSDDYVMEIWIPVQNANISHSIPVGKKGSIKACS
ncbi:transcriptional regulator [Pontibacillus halophilus JSM 076056 = DSM 19796]|uniref:Transcriptional regulator n=1 Tax=Pontibacillus halophilus JSM 076056 = DSM 19796 TaxID=1385510 RepID=A0A0A5I8E4_9BACI|nr:GyrI-like domain-containing protein [Pontibacillus halophilus]KGX92107.1 transcriptional regulator [Pontibacillus halophilus JSM 076056 = DSM 19796]